MIAKASFSIVEQVKARGLYVPLRVTSDGRADRICELSGDLTSFEEMRARPKCETFVYRNWDVGVKKYAFIPLYRIKTPSIQRE